MTVICYNIRRLWICYREAKIAIYRRFKSGLIIILVTVSLDKRCDKVEYGNNCFYIFLSIFIKLLLKIVYSNALITYKSYLSISYEFKLLDINYIFLVSLIKTELSVIQIDVHLFG